MKKAIFLLAFICSLLRAEAVVVNMPGKAANGWKAGVARINITPRQPLWMAGFAVRTHPSEGTRLDLWAKALAIEDAAGNKAVLVTTDLLGLPKEVSDNIRERLQAKFGLAKAQVLLNSSHTHSAPVLGSALSDIYPMDEAEKKKVVQYTRKLEDQIVDLVGNALKLMEPVQLYAQNGVTRFQVNRRNNKEATLLQQTELAGPNDYAVPVIKVVNAKGKLEAVAFGYSCHPTVLNDYKWSGDYPGFAQLELEKYYPGVTALFFQSAGADQNPLPRRSEALARQYGRELAAAVSRVLEEEMSLLPEGLKTAYTEINLPLDNPPTEAALQKVANDTTAAYNQRWATRMLAQMKQGKPFRTSYPYPLQVWKLGDQLLMGLGGELVIEYAIRLKKMYGLNTFVLGYSNDVMAYIPSARILQEGGYEGATSQMVYGLPTTWASGIEETIITGIKGLARQIGVETAESNSIKAK
jgi:neutral ceramidase